MLYRDFNELDNDYITIWSRLYCGVSMDEIKKYIRPLAELGQVNAVQNFYMLRGKGENISRLEKYFVAVDESRDSVGEENLRYDASINALKNSLNQPSDFDIKLARFNRFESFVKNDESTSAREKYIADLVHKWKKIADAKPDENSKEEEIEEYNAKLTLVRIELCRTELIEMYNDLISMAIMGCELNKGYRSKPIIRREFDLLRACGLLSYYWSLGLKNRRAVLSYFENQLHHSLKELKRAMKEYPHNLRYKYLFAKHINIMLDTNIGDANRVSLIDKMNMKKIFEELASRGLSKTLVDYMSKDKKTEKENNSNISKQDEDVSLNTQTNTQE